MYFCFASLVLRFSTAFHASLNGRTLVLFKKGFFYINFYKFEIVMVKIHSSCGGNWWNWMVNEKFFIAFFIYSLNSSIKKFLPLPQNSKNS